MTDANENETLDATAQQAKRTREEMDPKSEDQARPQHQPAKKQPPRGQRTQIWDKDSQRAMEKSNPDRKQATDEDYHNLGKSGGGVTRGDAGVD